MEKQLTKQQQRSLEGRCPRCGEFCYPYYLCHNHRIEQNIRRALNSFEKKGWVDISICDKDGKKMYKWNNTAPLDHKYRKYSPEAYAKMQLPRLKGKPMTDDVIKDCILKVLDTNGFPMTEKEIQKGIRSMKTIGQVVSEVPDLLREPIQLIKEKKSKLSKNQRNAVEYRVNFLIARGVI